MNLTRVQELDGGQADALRGIWFVGDVHGQFKYIEESLLVASRQPRWIIFTGDIDIDHKPFREALAPIYRAAPGLKVAFIHGNHDGDSHAHWEMLHNCGSAIPLHGRVIDMGGVLVAGLGGHFVGRVWYPPDDPKHLNRETALGGGAFRFRDGQRPASRYLVAIYPEDVQEMAVQRADILVTHEAPSCHESGFEVLDDLARQMKVARAFHGHQHDDKTHEYALQRDRLGFDAIALRYCQIKNGLGEEIFEGVEGW